MLPAGLKELLVLQERDMRRVQAERNLAAIPREREAVHGKIAAHRQAIEAARDRVNEVELRRKALEQTLASLEDQLQRFKGQQLMVKKNDEYQALTHEIEQTEAKISETEESEIEALYEVDSVKAEVAEIEKARLAEIAAEEEQLKRIDEREANLKAALEQACREVEEARKPVDPALLRRYDQLAKTIGLPVIVPLSGQKCGGCHLKVSAGVDSEARKGTEIVTCDNCTRILFIE
ncbi:MAG: hypothetical protein D6781_07975 [Verrucomicrobia bacterium]|nr:MAG: hypothetical protein D6781_07975 [Verrucomicrobiota bacterium]